MSRKSYLADQYKLMSLKTSDLFTTEETELFRKLLEIKKKIGDNKTRKADKKNPINADERKQIDAENKELNAQKKEINAEMKELIKSNKYLKREINISAVCDTRSAINGVYPPAIEWDNLKLSRQIQEFCSEGSRLLEIPINSVSWDKIIIAWKSIDILEQIVKNGFTAKVVIDGRIVEKEYMFMTASAGQLRRDKVQFISVDGYNKIYNSAYAGLSWKDINAHGGINVNKLLAYYGLSFSATERWDLEDGSKFSIRHCLVIPDFEAPVTGKMDHISRVFASPQDEEEGKDIDYKNELEERTEKINHCDGIGMKLPIVDKISRVKSKNDMVRGPWLKGLLTEFDYVKFCEKKGVPCVIKDFWGKEHDLIKEEIWVLFTESQLKLAKYYDSWEDYCTRWEENDCWICRTNYDEVDYEHNYLDTSPVNYQFLQTLACMTDEEKKAAMLDTREKIKRLASTEEAMLQTMGCDKPKTALQRCLKMYPALLRDGYCRDTIKQKKKLMTLNAKSGVLYCDNRRVYAIPDMYAACEFWFQHIKEPKGLLENGEVYCRLYKDQEELDILRSPHLYMEHAIRTNVVRDELKEWFKTGGVYTSCHDLISRILQFDVDGDMLNLCRERWMIDAAKRTIEKYDIVPLFYDPIKAGKEMVNLSNMFHGLKRAHENSGIGQISNALTKLWNRFDRPEIGGIKAAENNPEMWSRFKDPAEGIIKAAGWITYMNNRVIDAAKTGDDCKYPSKVKEIVDYATGGEHGKMPYFFQYSKNGRRADGTSGDKCEDKNRSVMNDLCTLACNDDVEGGLKHEISMNYRDVQNFNHTMLLRYRDAIDENVRQIFLDEAAICQSGIISSGLYDQESLEDFVVGINSKFELAADRIKKKILEYCSLEHAYYTIVMDLYSYSNLDKISYKRFFWEIFGDIAEENLKYNLEHCHICEDKHCKQLIPDWDTEHYHQCEDSLHYKCSMCNNIFNILNAKDTTKKKKNPCCDDCQKKRNLSTAAARYKAAQAKKKQYEAEQKMRELKAKILADLQYDIKIG